MSHEIKIPPVGESITEVTLATWLVEDGDYVEEGQALAEVESDKATLELPADASGVIKLMVEEGVDLEIGALVATLDTSAKGEAKEPSSASKEEEKSSAPEAKTTHDTPSSQESYAKGHPSVAAQKILAEKGINSSEVSGTGVGGRITKEDALAASKNTSSVASNSSSTSTGQKSAGTASEHISTSRENRTISREKMTRLRKTIAKKLTEAKNQTAMLTTFNEVDMSAIMELRSKYQDQFVKKYGIKLGMMSFFTKASAQALLEVPGVNAQIDGEEIVYHNYCDIGVAVSTDKGLVVPTLRSAEHMSLFEIEKTIIELATRAREGKITLEEMSGGTFTITNGGIFGSMLSTPIINTPQSAILGMHNIVKRPWVVGNEIKIRPIMYLALSYDHRLIDGKESVTFLKTVKEYLEDPARMLIGI